VATLTRAGYRGDAMITLIEKLQRQTRLEEQLMGLPEARDPSALSTHPGARDRLIALREQPGVHNPGDSGQEVYLTAIDGMSVDDAREEGYVRGSGFVHPVMRIAFTMPRDFRLYNDHDGVLGVGADRSLMYFTCRAGKVEGRLDDWMRNNMQ